MHDGSLHDGEAWHVAQLNVGRLLHPIDAPETAEFVANLDPVNALADRAPGFVWRLQDDTGNATSLHVNDDPLFIVNMSVWRSIADLEHFVRKSAHAEVLRRRRAWFERMTDAYLVLWWVRGGTIPTVADAMARLEHLQAHGPTSFAFTFRNRFDPPRDDQDAADGADDAGDGRIQRQEQEIRGPA
jgi:hypothetical protein